MLNKNQLYKFKLNLHALLKIKTVTKVNMMKLVIVDDERHKKKLKKTLYLINQNKDMISNHDVI
jgi:hypothetical protein